MHTRGPMGIFEGYGDCDPPTPMSADPMERLIEEALILAEIPYTSERENAANLDFYLPEYDIYIEVKQMQSDRIAAQMKRADNVIVAQGKAAVRLLATMITGNQA